MRRMHAAAVAVLFSVCFQLCAEDAKAEAREKLDTAIAEGIRLLEAKSHEAFLRAFVAPADFKKITDKQPLADFATKFAEKKAAQLLDTLKAIKDAKPKLEENDTRATFDLPKELGGSKETITFVKIDKYWYIQN